VHSYSNLNELLFDSDEKRCSILRTPHGDGEDKETIVVDDFFSDVLSGKKTKKVRSEERL
jgi:hypothetical protein